MFDLQRTPDSRLDQGQAADRWDLFPRVSDAGLHGDCVLRGELSRAGARLRHSSHEPSQGLPHLHWHPPLPHIRRRERHR